mmetsp:Transcript_69768/g.168831  ORF Transcript_69768/g.168831 Transcript_69768/m.168831 type:complete len:207 (-) Transcript_69768:778-1398(-)
MSSCQIPGMLVAGIPDRLLNVVEALLNCGMVHEAALEALDVLGMLAQGCLMLSVGSLDRLEVSGVLVRGVAQGFLQEVQPLRHRGVMLLKHGLVLGVVVLGLPQVLKLSAMGFANRAVLGEPAVQLLDLRVGAPQLLLVTFGCITPCPLHLLQLLRKAGVVLVQRLQVARKLRMSSFLCLQGPDMALVLVGRVSHDALKVVEALLH